MRRLRGSGGFTVLELMIVLTVIAIVAAIAVPAYQGFVQNTRAAQAVADLQAVRAAVYLYYGDTGQWPQESQAGFIPDGIQSNLPKNFVFGNKLYTLDYDNWIPLHGRGGAPRGMATAIGVSIVCRDPQLLVRVGQIFRDPKFLPVSKTKSILEIATINGF